MLEQAGKTEFFAFIFTLLIASLSVWIAAKIAKIKNANIGKSILIVIIILALIFAARIFSHNVLMNSEPGANGHILGYLIALLLSLVIIRAIFKTTFGRAALVLLFFVAVNLFGLIIAAEIFMKGISVYLSSL